MPLESFRNWQSKAISQKQAASSMMMGLSGGALAFSASLLGNAPSFIGCAQSAIFQIHGMAQLASIALGVAFSLNRVRDFDLTSQIARKREMDAASPALTSMRSVVSKWGRISRSLFYWQAVTFLIGAVAFTAFVFARYHNILYIM